MKNMKRSSSYSRETKKIRKLLNEEVKLGIHPSSDSETEDVDLHKELHPLSHYMNNKEEMVEQMFSIIKGDKLMKMLPPILKDMPLDELKADCLIHLLGMSKKRIMAILEGKEINSSSDSESHSGSSSPQRKTKTMVKPIVIKQEGCSDISDNSEEVILIDPDRELFDSLTSTKSTKSSAKGSKKSRNKISRHKHKLPDKRIKPVAGDEECDIQKLDKSEDLHESSPENTISNEDEIPKEGKTLLEILELEMRARAIRALLHKSDTPEEGVNLPEKSSPNRNISDEAEKNKIISKKKLRRKKRKNDDVIVITPKVVTIDLTDENDVSNSKKKPPESNKNNISENIIVHITQSKDDSHKELETTSKETDANKNECINLIEVDSDCTEISKKKEHSMTTEPNQSSESSTQSTKQSNLENLQKTEAQKSNWAQRWLESKEVKKVVSTSKICGNIRKRIKSAKLAKQSREDSQEVKSQEICGSVDEYQLLSKLSKVSDSSASSPLEVCNSENSLISNEGESEKQTEESKNTSSVEQVQDVSSTKNETTTDGKFFQENILDESSQENILDECNQESIIVVSNSEVLESGNTDRLDLKQNSTESKADDESNTSKVSNFSSDLIGNINLNNPDSHGLDDVPETSKPLLDRTVEAQNKQSELDNTKSKEKFEYFVSPSRNNSVPDSYLSTEQIQLADQSVNKETYCLQSNDNNTPSFDEGPCESNSGIGTSVEAVKACDLNIIPCEISKTLIQINEPETLEINITDEDRNIDGILDEKSELETADTISKS